VGEGRLVAGGNSNGDAAGAEDALDRAKMQRWTIVSMKEDWSAVFAGA
jgi:hypothetical protein